MDDHPYDAAESTDSTERDARAQSALPSDIQTAGAPDDAQRRGARRTLAQREAAARSDLATLAAERRRLRTRGAIVAGGLLTRLAGQRADLKAMAMAAARGLPERDREAFRLFAPELGQ